jgi:hypothetical protein
VYGKESRNLDGHILKMESPLRRIQTKYITYRVDRFNLAEFDVDTGLIITVAVHRHAVEADLGLLNTVPEAFAIMCERNTKGITVNEYSFTSREKMKEHLFAHIHTPVKENAYTLNSDFVAKLQE